MMDETAPACAHQPTARTYCGPKLFHCPRCGNEDYRLQYWVKVEDLNPLPRKPLYKGEEISLPVHCGRLNTLDNDEHEICMAAMDQVHEGIQNDLLPDGFEVDRETLGEAGGGKRRIATLSEIRRIERDSLRRHEADPHRNAPLVFRDFSQNRSNRHVNSFKDTNYERSRSTRVQRPKTQSGMPISIRAVDN